MPNSPDIQTLISEAVAAETRRCAGIARHAMLVPPDGGSPTPEEVAICERIEKAILSGQEGDGWLSKALDDIAAERARQISAEGWTPEHDDEHRRGEMANAAAAYARRAGALIVDPDLTPYPFRQPWWPWDAQWWKPKDPRRNLVRAAALIVAEIERLDRLPAPPLSENKDRKVG